MASPAPPGEIVRIRSQWNRIWERQDLDENMRTAEYSGLMPILSANLRISDRILEGGCGLGRLVAALEGRGYAVIGIDDNISPLRRLRRARPETSVVQGDILALSLARGSLDAYISIGVIEHFIEGPMRALQEAWRTLRPGGVLVVSVPCMNRLRAVLRPVREPTRRIRHWFRCRPLLRRALSKSPLRPEQLEYFYQYYFTKEGLGKVLTEARFNPRCFYALEHELGLYRDLGALRRFVHVGGTGQRGGAYPLLNSLGRWLCRYLNRDDPYTTNHMVACVAERLGDP